MHGHIYLLGGPPAPLHASNLAETSHLLHLYIHNLTHMAACRLRLLSRQMAIDDSFKKPGAVPFNWEIRPGVPKIHTQQPKLQPKQLSPPVLPSPSPRFAPRRPSPASLTQQKLKPPPAGFIFLPPPEPRTHSFRSTPRTRSERWSFHQPTRVGPECVSPGCFPSPLLRRKDSKRRTTHVAESESDYTSDLETLGRWSVSSRKSFSASRDSPASSYSSYRSSPRVVSDAEWAGFGLF